MARMKKVNYGRNSVICAGEALLTINRTIDKEKPALAQVRTHRRKLRTSAVRYRVNFFLDSEMNTTHNSRNKKKLCA